MSDLERAKLIPVSGNQDTPDMSNAIDVQFNPTSLKVTLSNTLKENQRNGNSRASQFVDKSSSSLTVELIFDSTYIEAASNTGKPPGQAQGAAAASSGTGHNAIEQGSDVRLQTKKIADAFIKPIPSGSKMKAPKRCLFQWGAFQFIGLVDSFEETVDFFSPSGRPLRASVSLKLKEDRYQFRTRATSDSEKPPQLQLTGVNNDKPKPGANGAPGPNQNLKPMSGNWRNNALFNGLESPRLPATPVLALPGVSLGEGAGFGIGASAASSLHASSGSGESGAPVGGSSAALADTGPTPSPAFKYGNSTALGTGVPGAFSANPNASLKASSLRTGSLQLRAQSTAISASGEAISSDSGNHSRPRATSRTASAGADATQRSSGISVASLLKSSPDNGVGFD